MGQKNGHLYFWQILPLLHVDWQSVIFTVSGVSKKSMPQTIYTS